MKRFKVDEYKVIEKGRTYSVIVFPFIEYIWAYDNWKEDGCYMIDGTVEAFEILSYAMAILIEASDKIIYFPCKQSGIGRFYAENFYLVLCTPKAQLCRSKWIKIRRKLKYAQKRSYVLQYNRKKLDDYCKRFLMEQKYIWKRWKYYVKSEISNKIKKSHLEEVVGETLFMVMGKEECYVNHYRIAEDIDEYDPNEEYGAWSAMGWFITEAGINDMKEKVKKDEAKNI